MKRWNLWFCLAALIACLLAQPLALAEGAPAAAYPPITAAYQGYSDNPLFVPVGMTAEEMGVLVKFGVTSSDAAVTNDADCYRQLFDETTLALPDGAALKPRFAIVPTTLGGTSFSLMFDSSTFSGGKDTVGTNQLGLVFAVPKGVDVGACTLWCGIETWRLDGAAGDEPAAADAGAVEPAAADEPAVPAEDVSPKALLDQGAKDAAERAANAAKAVSVPVVPVVPSVPAPSIAPVSVLSVPVAVPVTPDVPVAEAPDTASDKAADVPAEEPAADVPAEEPAADVPAEEPAADVPAEEPAAEVPAEEPAPTPDPAAALRARVTAFIDAAFDAQLAKEKDAWVRAALEQGRAEENLDVSEPDKKGARTATLTFKLRLYDATALKRANFEDDAAYLHAVAERCGEYNFDAKVTVSITEKNGEETLKWGKYSFQTLYKKVQTAAGKAKKVFSAKAMQAMMLKTLWPSPMTAPKKAPTAITTDAIDGAEVWALADADGEFATVVVAALYAQKNAAVDVSGGPNALALTFYAPDPDAVMKAAYKTAYNKLAKTEKANAFEEDKIAARLASAVTSEAIAFRHGKDKGAQQRWAFDLSKLTGGDAIPDGEVYLAAWAEAFSTRRGTLIDKVYEMPDYPKLDFPKTGRLSGSKSGQKVAFKMPNDGKGHYLRLDSADKKGVVSAFIRSGETVMLNVPANVEYTIVLGEGKDWYGKNFLFGYDGAYSIADQPIYFEKTGNSRYMQYTISSGGSGNPLSGAGLDDVMN